MHRCAALILVVTVCFVCDSDSRYRADKMREKRRRRHHEQKMQEKQQAAHAQAQAQSKVEPPPSQVRT